VDNNGQVRAVAKRVQQRQIAYVVLDRLLLLMSTSHCRNKDEVAKCRPISGVDKGGGQGAQPHSNSSVETLAHVQTVLNLPSWSVYYGENN